MSRPEQESQVTFVGVKQPFGFTNAKGEQIDVPVKLQFVRTLETSREQVFDGPPEAELVEYALDKWIKANSGSADIPDLGDEFLTVEVFVKSRRNSREIYTVLDAVLPVAA